LSKRCRNSPKDKYFADVNGHDLSSTCDTALATDTNAMLAVKKEKVVLYFFAIFMCDSLLDAEKLKQ
jgi:hypothetical protein